MCLYGLIVTIKLNTNPFQNVIFLSIYFNLLLSIFHLQHILVINVIILHIKSYIFLLSLFKTLFRYKYLFFIVSKR